MLVTSKCLLLPQLLLLQEKNENFSLSDSKSFKKNKINKRYLEGSSRYLEIFLRVSGKIFRRFYVIFVERPRTKIGYFS